MKSDFAIDTASMLILTLITSHRESGGAEREEKRETVQQKNSHKIFFKWQNRI